MSIYLARKRHQQQRQAKQKPPAAGPKIIAWRGGLFRVISYGDLAVVERPRDLQRWGGSRNAPIMCITRWETWGFRYLASDNFVYKSVKKVV